jgi:hypothetical protein
MSAQRIASKCAINLCLLGLLWMGGAAGCKNVVREPLSDSNSGPGHSLDYSFVKYASYNADRVLSAGEYVGHPGRTEVLQRAQQDLVEARQKRCGLGSSSSFCLQADGEPVEWIQLFMPDGSSCAVGPIPEGVNIAPCS